MQNFLFKFLGSFKLTFIAVFLAICMYLFANSLFFGKIISASLNKSLTRFNARSFNWDLLFFAISLNDKAYN